MRIDIAVCIAAAYDELEELGEYSRIDLDTELRPFSPRPLRIPTLVVEFVKDFPRGKDIHENHLLMAMSTALAFSSFLRINLPVFWNAR